MRFLVVLRFRTGLRPKFLDMSITGVGGMYEILNRLEKSDPRVYGNYCHNGVGRVKTKDIVTIYKAVDGLGWTPPVDEIDMFMAREIANSDDIPKRA